MEMIQQTPIFIAGPPRSGTTMLAGLLQHHGLWIGRARTTMFPGSNSNVAAENIDIKEIMKREAKRLGYRNWRMPLPEQIKYSDKLKKEIESFVPEDTRWLVKTSWVLTFHEFWNQAYPDAIWILTKRTTPMIFDSMNRHTGMRRRPDNMKKKFIIGLKERQAEVQALVKNSITIDVKKISMKNWEAIENLFNFLDLKMDWDAVDKFIEPNRMK